MTDCNKFPLEIKRLSPAETAEMFKYQNGTSTRLVRVGPKGYICPDIYDEEKAASIYNMPLRPSDIFVVTFPRSGTTWSQELVWLLANDLDYAKAKAVPLTERYPFLEQAPFFKNNDFLEALKHEKNSEKLKIMKSLMTPATEILATTPSPRFIKTHLPLSLLPPSLLDTAKVVYVARDPRDVVVSYYHFSKSFEMDGYTGDLKSFWNMFIKDLLKWTPFLEHVKEAWRLRHHPNMLFLFYEELIKDLKGSARRVADFLGKEYSDEQLAALSEHLSFDVFRKNNAVDLADLKTVGIFKSEMNFVRKGKAGGWRESFDAEMVEQAEKWMAENLRDTDLRFPDGHH